MAKKYDYANFMYDRQFNDNPNIKIFRNYGSKKPPVTRQKQYSQEGKGVQKGERIGHDRVGDASTKDHERLNRYISGLRKLHDKLTPEQAKRVRDHANRRNYDLNSRWARGVYMENLSTSEEYQRWDHRRFDELNKKYK